jgi:hypothetical protein
MLLWRIRRQDPNALYVGGSVLSPRGSVCKIQRVGLRFGTICRTNVGQRQATAAREEKASVSLLLACPARAQRCFLFIVASSTSGYTAAGSASSNVGCAEDAPRPERPAPLEPGGTWLMDRFASRWE